MRLERTIEIIEKAIPFHERPNYVYIKISVEEDGTANYSRKLITPGVFSDLLKEYKWVESSRKLLGSTWPFMIRQCDDEHSLNFASKHPSGN